MKTKQWFEVDREGLSKLIEKRGKGFLLTELVQNAWDQDVTFCDVEIDYERGYVSVRVEDDDPNGFSDLSHAYTLFAESGKKSNPNKRGRFNLGEKLVLSLCKRASVATTTGLVHFTEDGRETFKVYRDAGSVFAGTVKATKAEYEEMLSTLNKLIPPASIRTTINEIRLSDRKPLSEFEVTLMTEYSGEDGVIRRNPRKTTVEVHPVLPGEEAFLYEMGIPVVETTDKWHYNICQRVPLNMERDNVTPGYLRTLRTEVLNNMAEQIAEEDANAPWVRDACRNDAIESEAVRKVMDLRFGEKRVVFDPSDHEANAIAMSKGYTVIAPRSLSAEEWKQVRAAGAAMPSGQVTPSPKPFAESGRPLEYLPVDSWTPQMVAFKRFVDAVAQHAFGVNVTLQYVKDRKWKSVGSSQMVAACYGGRTLTWNLAAQDLGIRQKVLDVLIHELAHEISSNHLSENFYNALSLIGSKVADKAITSPELFEKVWA